MLHHVGQGEKKEWLKLVYLSNVITWRGFGNTNKKKKTKAKRESGDGQMKRERGRRRRRRNNNRRFGVTGNSNRRLRHNWRLVWATCCFKYLVQPLLSCLLLPCLLLFFSYQYFGARFEKSPKCKLVLAEKKTVRTVHGSKNHVV